jgi:hypothetical protein
LPKEEAKEMKSKSKVHKVRVYADTTTACGKECAPGVVASRVWAQVTCAKCLEKQGKRKR